MKTWSNAEIRDLFLQVWPDGQLYDWFSPSSWMSKWLDAVADTLGQYVYSMIEALKLEAVPSIQMTAKIGDWLAALGLSGSSVAVTGTLAQQRNAILSRLRESGGWDLLDVRGILGTLLGYADPSQLVIYDDNGYAIDAVQTYYDGRGNTVNLGWPLTASFWVFDAGRLDLADIRVFLTFPSIAHLEALTVTVTAPNGKQLAWAGSTGVFGTGPATNYATVLRGRDLAASGIGLTNGNAGPFGQFGTIPTTGQGPSDLVTPAGGLWTIALSTSNAGGGDQVSQIQLRAQGNLTSSYFDWLVYADSTLVGGNGASPDYVGTTSAIRRIQHAYAHGGLAQTLTPKPDIATCVPDTFFPG